MRTKIKSVRVLINNLTEVDCCALMVARKYAHEPINISNLLHTP